MRPDKPLWVSTRVECSRIQILAFYCTRFIPVCLIRCLNSGNKPVYKKVLPPQTHLDVVTLNLLIYYCSDVCVIVAFTKEFTVQQILPRRRFLQPVAGKTKKKEKKNPTSLSSHNSRFMTDAARREHEAVKKKVQPKLSLTLTGSLCRSSVPTPPRHTSGNLTPPVTPPITPSSSFRSSTPTGTKPPATHSCVRHLLTVNGKVHVFEPLYSFISALSRH